MTTKILTRKATLALGALMAYLAPKLAQDAKVDLRPALEGVTAKNFGERKDAIVTAVTASTKDKLAKDAKIDDLPELLMALDGVPADPDEEEAKPAADPNETVPKTAMDEAVKAAEAKGKTEGEAAGRAAAKADHKAVRDAETAVRPYVGELAMDGVETADDVYRAAFKVLGVEVKDVHASAFPALLKAQKKSGASIAEDAALPGGADTKTYAERFPSAARLG